MHLDNCTCEQQPPEANPICDACQEAYGGVVAELYATDEKFMAEMDRWCAADSPEGQRILAELEDGAR